MKVMLFLVVVVSLSLTRSEKLVQKSIASIEDAPNNLSEQTTRTELIDLEDFNKKYNFNEKGGRNPFGFNSNNADEDQSKYPWSGYVFKQDGRNPFGFSPSNADEDQSGYPWTGYVFKADTKRSMNALFLKWLKARYRLKKQG